MANLLEPSEMEWKFDENGWSRYSSWIFYSPKNIHQQGVFNPFEVNPKSWSAFLKEGGIYPQQPTSATTHFSFQLGEPWSAIIFSYVPVFFSFQKAIPSSIGTVSTGPTKQIFLLRDMTKASTCFVVWQISWGKCFYWECLEFWKFEENCPIIWGSKISIESLFLLLCDLAELIVEAVAFSFTKWMPWAVSFWLSWLRCWTLQTIALHRTVPTFIWCCLVLNIQHPRTTTHNMPKGHTVRFSAQPTA